jgi:hypothetical protein
MVIFLRSILYAIIFISTISYASAQYYLAVDDATICYGQKVNFTAFPGGATNTYKLMLVATAGPDQQIGSTQTNNTVFSNVSITSTGKYYVIINDGADHNTNQVTITVNYAPASLPCDLAFNTTFQSTDGPKSLNNFMAPVPPSHTITYSGIGVYGNQFYPSTYPTGIASVTLQYTLKDNSTGCVLGPVSTCPVKVNYSPPPPPAFLQPLNALPFCENGGPQPVLIDVGSDAIITSVVVTPVSALQTSSSPNYYQRNLTIRPEYNTNNNIHVVVNTTDIFGNPQTPLDGYLTVLARFRPQITGLVSSYYFSPGSYSPGSPGFYTSFSGGVCIGNDTAVLRGYPLQGKFKFFKVVGSVTTLMPNGINGVYPKDSCVQKFVSKSFFQDSLGGVASSKLIIRFVVGEGGTCPDSISYTINFVPPTYPDMKYAISTAPPYCYGDTLTLNVSANTTQPTPCYWCYPYDGSVKNYERYSWTFGNGSSLPNDISRTVKYYYDKPGQYYLRFKAYRATYGGPQCYVDSLQLITIGAKPKVNFEIKDPYLNTATIFENKTIIPPPATTLANDTLNHWNWYFGDGTQFYTTKDTTVHHSYTASTLVPYPVSLVAVTSKGCKDSLVKDIPIFPVLSPAITAPYTNSFDVTTPTGWYESGLYRQVGQRSSWRNIAPNGTVINSTQYGNAWITSKTRTASDSAGYYPSETSWVESPAFQLSSIDRPMMSFNTWGLSETQLDGASLQYALCDTTFGNEQWHTLGKPNGGLNWYNYSIVITKPGGEYPGWSSSTSKDWQLSSYALEEVRDSAAKYSYKYPVRFRIAFNSNAENAPGIYDGFAFDNFFVGQRNRKVLVEEFCDYNNYENKFNSASSQNNSQLVRVQYHSRYMNLDDQINNQNIGETGARNLLYGYSQLPRAAVDGYYSLDYDNPFFNNIGESNFSKRILQVSPFTITIGSPGVSNNGLNFKVSMTRNSTVANKGPFVMQVAVLEKQVVGNGKTFTNVFRKFLPHASGEHVDKDAWTVGSTKILDRSFTPFTDLTARANPTDTSIILVAFVQDEATSEVYQSEAYYVSYSLVQSLSKVPLPKKVSTVETGITIYPNPTQSSLTVHFNAGSAEENYAYNILDIYGQTIATGTIDKDVQEFNVPGIQTIPVGVYQLQLLGTTTIEAKTFTIVR